MHPANMERHVNENIRGGAKSTPPGQIALKERFISQLHNLLTYLTSFLSDSIGPRDLLSRQKLYCDARSAKCYSCSGIYIIFGHID